LHVTTELVLVHGGWVTAHWTIHRARSEESCDNGTSRQHGSWTSIRLFRIVDGKIVEEWYHWAAIRRLQDLFPICMPELPQGYTDINR
jgi:hypothetical protein